MLGAILVLVILVLALTGERNRRPLASGRNALVRTLVMVAVLAVIVGAMSVLRDREHRTAPEPAAGGAAVVGEVPPPEGSERPTWPLTMLGSAVVVALAWAAWSARRRRHAADAMATAPSEDGQRAAAGSAFAASLADLEAEPDPRRAIIAAYARLLDGLDAAGFGRRSADAPEEHLRRTLAQLRIPDAPMRTLVALFAEARFSEHALTIADKQTAIDAFRAARDDLAGLSGSVADAGGSA